MRTIVKTLLTLVVVLIIAWLGLWFYAEARMQSGLENWVARMQSQGDIKVSYDSINRGSSPLAASVTLTNVQLIIQPDQTASPVSVTLPSLGLAIDVTNPLMLKIVLPNQLNVNTPRADLATTFGSISMEEQLDLHAVLNHEIDPFTASSASATNINFLASSGSLLLLHIDSFTAQGDFNRNAGATSPALTVSESIDGIALSPLLTRLASIPFSGKITQLGLNFSLSGPIPANWQAIITQINALPPADRADRAKISLQAIHNWAAQGGNANGSLALILGPTTLNAAGTVKFDANAQPSGTASLTADHLDAFSAAITTAYPVAQNTVNEMQARLSPYLTVTASGGQTLNLNITYGNGAAILNGQTTPLPPINWTLLENTPPQAPGDGSGAASP